MKRSKPMSPCNGCPIFMDDCRCELYCHACDIWGDAQEEMKLL